MKPVLNPDGSQAISAADCERYHAHLRTLTHRQLANEMERWHGFVGNRVTPWPEDIRCERVVYEEMERSAIREADTRSSREGVAIKSANHEVRSAEAPKPRHA